MESTNPEALPEYQYSPLKQGEIRVLYLYPGAFDEPLAGYHIHVPLSGGDSSILYDAISYAWGPRVFSKSIKLNGRLLRITESLYSALRGLREDPTNDDGAGCVLLWADAICINQLHNDEKSTQVAMMAQIFRTAATVQVWLGEATPRDTLAFWMIECVLDYVWSTDYPEYSYGSFTAHYKRWLKSHKGKIRDQINLFGRGDPNALEIECFNAIAALSARSWFSRLWVIQEVTLAQDVLVRCGHLAIPLMDLRQFIITYHDRGEDWINKAILCDDAYMKSVGIFMRLEDMTVFLPKYTPAERLLWFLGTLDGFGVSDKRDFVYAMRDLVFLEPTQCLLPNYNITLAQLWQEVAVFLLGATAELHVGRDPSDNIFSILALPAVQGQSRIAQLPSWIPDLGAINSQCTRKILFYNREARYNFAGGPRHHRFSFSPCQSILLVQGCMLAQIGITSKDSSCPYLYIPAGDEIERWDDYFVSILEWRKKCAEFLVKDCLLDGAQSLVSFLVQGARNEFFEGPIVDLEMLLNRNRARPSANTDSFDLPEEDRVQVLRDIQPFFRAKDAINHLDLTRCLAKTSDDTVGWVPQGTLPGDFVTLFRGAPFPFILRRLNDGCYSIVGDAHIDGIMKGEACPEDDDGWTTIAIK